LDLNKKNSQHVPEVISRNILRHAFGDALSGAGGKKADIPGST